MVKILKAFGKNLRDIRKAHTYTQETLGLECDLTPQYISEIERGEINPPLLTIIKIANALKIPVGRLFTIPGIIKDDKDKIIALLNEIDPEKQEDVLKAINMLLKSNDG